MGRGQKKSMKLQKKNNAAKIIITLVLLFLIAGMVFLYFHEKKKTANLEKEIVELKEQIETEAVTWDERPTTEISISLIESEIKDIGELATVEYIYTDAGKFEDPKKAFGIDIPFTKKSFIAKWDGTIKAGIQVDKIKIDVDNIKNEIVIEMPKAEILSHEVDGDSIETLDEKDGLFNPVKVDDVRKFDVEGKEAMEKRAIENGMLDKANERAKEIINKIVNNEVVKEQGYTVIFEESND